MIAGPWGRLFGDNPLYRPRSYRRTAGYRWSLGIALTLGVVYYCGLAVELGGSLRGTFLIGLLSSHVLILALITQALTPVLTALALQEEKDRGTLDSLLVSPFPRGPMLAGIAGTRLDPVLWLLLLLLPGFLLLASQSGAYAASTWVGLSRNPAGAWSPQATMAAIHVLGVLGQFAFGAAAGLWAAGRTRSSGGAIALALALGLVGLPFLGCLTRASLLPILMVDGGLGIGGGLVFSTGITCLLEWTVAWWLFRSAVIRLEAREPGE